MTSVRKAVAYLWASPWTALGLLLGTLAWLAGATLRQVDGTLEIAGGALARFASRAPARASFVAITFGHVILGTDHATLAQLRRHEHAHVRQYERWGPLFVPLYLGSSLWHGLRSGAPHRDNAFERAARAAELGPPAAMPRRARSVHRR